MSAGTDFGDKSYLVIDDFSDMRSVLRSILRSLGATRVDQAADGAEAVSRMERKRYDVILCDYMLGDGRSGQQLLEELRRFNLLADETIFMMVTGEQSYEQVVSAVELVPDDYIIKPFSPDKLVLRLDRIMAKKEFFRAYYR